MTTIEPLDFMNDRLTELRQMLLWVSEQEYALQVIRDRLNEEYAPLLKLISAETGLATPQPGAVVATKVTPQFDKKATLAEMMKNPNGHIGYLAIRADAMNVLLTLAIDHASGLMRNSFELNEKALKTDLDGRYNDLLKNGVSEADALNQLKSEFVGFTGFKVDLTTQFKPTSATDVTPVQPPQITGALTLDPDVASF